MMTGRRGVWGLAVGLLLIGLGTGTASAAATLRWKLKPGESLHYTVDQTTVSTAQDPEGREIKQTFQVIMDLTWTAKAVDPSGTATVAQTIDRLRTSAVAPFGKFSFDSKDAGAAGGAAGPLFKMLVGAEFTFKLSPRGEIADIQLSDKLLAALREQPAGAVGQFSEPGLKNMIAQLVTPLPEAAVDLGATWKQALTIPAGPDGQTRRIEQTFAYKGPVAGAGAEAIEFSTKFDPIPVDPNVPVAFKKEVATGHVEFDAAAGRIAKSTVVEDVELSNKVDGKEMPLKVETTRVLSLSKDKAT